MYRTGVALVVVFALGAGTAAADEKIENPEFTTWSKFKKGTSITLTSMNTIRGKPSTQILTQTLVEVDAEKVVLVTEVVIKIQGETLKPNGLRREVSKMMALPKGEKKEDVLVGKPAGTFEEGTETLNVCGTDTKTRWFKYKTETDGTKTEGKVWVSATVPGLTVKMERVTEGRIPETVMLEVTEFKKP